jgi:hypothetical protein
MTQPYPELGPDGPDGARATTAPPPLLEADPPTLSFLDVAICYDLTVECRRWIDVLAIADPSQPHVRVGDLRFTPEQARRLSHALIVAAAAADDELTAG